MTLFWQWVAEKMNPCSCIPDVAQKNGKKMEEEGEDEEDEEEEGEEEEGE